MRKDNFNIKIEYKPFSAYKNVLVLSGSNRQNYNANTRFFEPDRRIDPYVVLVECGVNDIHGLVTGLVNANLTDVSWKMSSSTGYKEIETTNNEFRIGTGADKGKLTVFKNVSDIEAVTILFTARFYHADTKRTLNFQESFNLVTLPVAQAPVLLETSAPVGFNLYPTENNQGLLCQADLYQGAEKLPAAYWWYKGTTLLTDANGYQGTAKNKLFVPAAELSKTGDVYKCEVADCSEYFNELVHQKVEEDVEVVEWRELYRDEPENYISKYSSGWGVWNPINKFAQISATGAVRAWKENDVSNTAVGIIIRDHFDLFKGVSYKIHFIGLPYYDNNLDTLFSYCYIMHNSGNIALNTVRLIGPVDELITGTAKGYMMELEFTVPRDLIGARFMIGSRRMVGEYHSPDYFGFYFKFLKLSISKPNQIWSPSKIDIKNLITQKTTEYKTQTSLPENYRPSPKPTKLYKSDFMLMKKYPQYEVDVLYPTTVSPEATSVQVEMVLTTNAGVIPNPELYFSVGWIKNTDGTFKYKGFKVNISIADIQALNTANKQLDYELREDLTLKV